MVMPRSRSRSMVSRTCSIISRCESAPVISSSRSASVDLPWSMCAMIEKLRMNWGSMRCGDAYNYPTAAPDHRQRRGAVGRSPKKPKSPRARKGKDSFASDSLFRSPAAALPRRRRRNRIRFSDPLEQRERNLPELRGSGQAPVKSNDLRAGRLCESDQVAVGDRFRGRLEGKGRRGLPEQSLGAARLVREFYARILRPPVVQSERPGQSGYTVAHDLPIRQQAQEAEHGEPAEQKRRVVNGGVPAGSGGVLRMLLPGQRQPDVDVNQVRGHRAFRCWGITAPVRPSP